MLLVESRSIVSCGGLDCTSGSSRRAGTAGKSAVGSSPASIACHASAGCSSAELGLARSKRVVRRRPAIRSKDSDHRSENHHGPGSRVDPRPGGRRQRELVGEADRTDLITYGFRARPQPNNTEHRHTAPHQSEQRCDDLPASHRKCQQQQRAGGNHERQCLADTAGGLRATERCVQSRRLRSPPWLTTGQQPEPGAHHEAAQSIGSVAPTSLVDRRSRAGRRTGHQRGDASGEKV